MYPEFYCGGTMGKTSPLDTAILFCEAAHTPEDVKPHSEPIFFPHMTIRGKEPSLLLLFVQILLKCVLSIRFFTALCASLIPNRKYQTRLKFTTPIRADRWQSVSQRDAVYVYSTYTAFLVRIPPIFLFLLFAIVKHNPSQDSQLLY